MEPVHETGGHGQGLRGRGFDTFWIAEAILVA